MPVIHDKISVYKTDKKKMPISTIKKEELKGETLDINSYKQRVFNSKKALTDKGIKIEKTISFLPNMQLIPSEFQQIGETTDEPFSIFKKKMNFLNYFS